MSTFWVLPKYSSETESYPSLFYNYVSAAWRLVCNKTTAKAFARTIICASGSDWDGTGDLTETNQSGTQDITSLYSGQYDIRDMHRVRALLYKTSEQTAATYHLIAALLADFNIRRRLEAGEMWECLPEEIRLVHDLAGEVYAQQARVQESEYWQYYDYIPEEERENARPATH